MEYQDLESRVAQIETSLNEITRALKTALAELAEIVRSGSEADTATKIEEIGGIPCEHWPNCFTEMKKNDGY